MPKSTHTLGRSNSSKSRCFLLDFVLCVAVEEGRTFSPLKWRRYFLLIDKKRLLWQCAVCCCTGQPLEKRIDLLARVFFKTLILSRQGQREKRKIAAHKNVEQISAIFCRWWWYKECFFCWYGLKSPYQLIFCGNKELFKLEIHFGQISPNHSGTVWGRGLKILHSQKRREAKRPLGLRRYRWNLYPPKLF